jgi:hypothetical protein
MCGESSSFCTWEVIGISCNLTDMHRKASACLGLHVAMVPELYQREGVCIDAGVTVVGACEQRNENGMHGGAGYVVGVSVE